ncbi:hypothetical protein ACIHDR_22430 [Nocardia sp. NPDC052278]|uniref:hypothetical protein n=1 Tax=unclassified Nocardia TaxID=2637762 RepID=UPI00369F72EB
MDNEISGAVAPGFDWVREEFAAVVAPLLKPDTLTAVTAIHSTDPDLVRGDRAPYALGFEAKGLYYPFLSANAFGHAGAAGHDGVAEWVGLWLHTAARGLRGSGRWQPA